MTFSGHWYQYCCHVMLTASSMAALLHYVQKAEKGLTLFFGHVMSLLPASASCDTNGIINGTTTFF